MTLSDTDDEAARRRRGLPFTLSNPDLFLDNCYIDGKPATPKETNRFEVIDPATGQSWASCADSTVSDVEIAVQAAHRAFRKYALEAPRKRAQMLLAFHQLVVSYRDDLAKILVYETGKPLAEAYGEIDYGTTFTWWFVGEAERLQGTVSTSSTPGRRILTIKQPIGVVVAMVPWNFPLALVLRKTAAAVAAGCTMIVKPSPETPFTALCLAQLATRAGFPPGVFNVLTASTENTPMLSEALCSHTLVKKVTFTGSTRVGRIIATNCGNNLKKTTLELGGNCPFIIFDDADLPDAISQLMGLKWRHAGQACITANRVYVQNSIYDQVVAALVEGATRLRMGHGMDQETTLGPLTTARGAEKAQEIAEDAVSKGATLAIGTGKRMIVNSEGGHFFAPTILTDMKDHMLLSREEVFAPILGLYRFDTEDEVISRANNTPLGLASYVFTTDTDRLWRLFEKLEAGMVGLNSGNSSAADAPFGGIKDSGWGKESGKDIAINEFMISKTGTLSIKNIDT